MSSWLNALWMIPWKSAGYRRMTGSVLVSACVHASLLAACALWMFSSPTPQQQLFIHTDWDEAHPPEITSLEPLPLSVRPDDQPSGGASRGVALFHQTDGEIGRAESPDLASLPWLETDGERPVPDAQTQAVGLAGGQGQGERTGTGQGIGDGNGTGNGDGSTFFGLDTDGRRVVYVVDASRSMNHPHPGPMKTRFGRVKLELIRSVSAMTRQQEFFIVYFNDRAFPMPATTLKLAVPSMQQKYLRWAAQAKAYGKTDPEQALLVALMLNPDVIYFLTDGAFPPRVVDRVREANNRSRVTIHTIGFGDDGGEVLLKEIAFQNWGTYQFIPADEADTPADDR